MTTWSLRRCRKLSSQRSIDYLQIDTFSKFNLAAKMPARKRSAPETVTRRRSGRASLTKSSYFEGSDSESDHGPPAKRRSLKKWSNTADDYEGESEKSDDEEADYKDEPAVAEDDGDDDDDDEDEEEDEDRPLKRTFIPLEKMRDAGGIEYADSKVHKNTMLFLKDLKANNKRSWLKAHDGEYRRALKDWTSFVDATTETMSEVDETIPELPAKDVMFRIHRDIRFSKDPTPYKPHFSAAWSRTGRKGPYACYYIHCEPGSSFIGGGLWHPEASHVSKLRRSIDRHPERWREAFSNEQFRNVFFPQVKSIEGVVKAFVGKNQSNALKKRPMGYDVTHRDIELLKLKNFTVGTKINEDILCKDSTQEKLSEIMTGLLSFVTFLNGIVMPDAPEESSDEEDEEE